MTEPNTRKTPSRLSNRERWLHRTALLLMAAFTLLGVYILYYPTELLIALFAVLAVVTISVGLIAGIVAVYAE